MIEWIKWEGGECPVHGNTLVDVEWQNGERDFRLRAKHVDFKHIHEEYNVVAYRLTEQRTLEEACEDADRPVSDSFQERALGTQVAGDHYLQFEIQPVTYINANNMDFLQGNVIKYISRHKLKGGADDVKKAIHFCKLILELQYGEE